MKKIFLFSVILASGLMFSNISVLFSQTPVHKNTVTKQNVKYTCTMHPEVIKDKPGNCPKCGMTLVVKKDKFNKEMHQSNDSTMMKQDNTKMKKDSTSMKNKKMVK